MQIELPNDVSNLTKEQLNNLKVVMCQLHTYNQRLEQQMNLNMKYSQSDKDENDAIDQILNMRVSEESVLKTYWRMCENSISDIYENERFNTNEFV